jgi:hypothetical protein
LVHQLLALINEWRLKPLNSFRTHIAWLLKVSDDEHLHDIKTVKMRLKRFPPILTRLSCALLLLSISTSALLFPSRVNAQWHLNLNEEGNRSKISSDLRNRASQGDELVNVILQLKGPVRWQLWLLLRRNGVRVKKEFRNLESKAV